MRVLDDVVTIAADGFIERIRYVTDDKRVYRQGVKDCIFWLLCGALGVVLVVAFVFEVVG